MKDHQQHSSPIHHFIFNTGTWLGEGMIKFSSSPEQIKFYTKWEIPLHTQEKITCSQTVEMTGVEEQVKNTFNFFHIKSRSFSIEIENDLVGKVQGKGLKDEKTIAWEFTGNSDFEGFEVYELQDNGDYLLHAEYASTDQFRTIIDGRIWKKSL